MAKKLLIGGLVLVALLVGAALVAPGFVDWNRFKPEIAARVEKATGRRLAIDGDLDATLLPAPALIVEKVRLSNAPGASAPDMARLDSLRVNVALLPLLSGRIEVASVRLVRPEIALEIAADGRPNWAFAPPATGAEPSAAPADKTTVEADDSGGGPAVVIQAVRIEDGTVTYVDARDGTRERVEAIDATLGAESLRGPFRGEGSLRLRGTALAFDGTLGRIDAAAAPAWIALRLPDAKTRLVLAGEVRPGGDNPGFTGKVEIEADRLASLATALAPDAPPLPAAALRLEGQIAADRTRVALDDLAVKLGDADIFGAASVALGTPVRADLVLTVGRLRLDPWLDALDRPASAPATGQASGDRAASAPSRAADGKQAPAAPGAGFALPAGLAANLDLSVEALVVRDRAFTDVRFNAALGDGRLRVIAASARLPGDALARLEGELTAAKGAPRFRGRVEAGADNLRGVLAAFGALPAGVSANGLHKFDLGAAIDATPAQIDLTDLRVGLDLSRLTGAVALVPGARPALGARLHLDALDLSAYLPEARPTTSAKGAPAAGGGGGKGAPMALALPEGGRGLPVLNAFDANLDLRVDRLAFQNVQARDLRLDGTLQGGALTLRNLSVADLAGAGVRMTGAARSLDGNPVLDLAVAASAADTAGLFALAEIAPPLPPGTIGAVALDARIKGGLDGLDLDFRSRLLGGSVIVTGRAAPGRDLLDSRLSFAVTHPEAKTLFAALAPTYRPAGATLGKLEFRGALETSGRDIRLSGLRAAVGPAAVSGDAEIGLSGAKPKFVATLAAGEVRIDPLLPAPGGLSRPAQPSARGAATAAPAGAPAREGPWSSAPIDLSFLRAFDGQLALTADALLFRDFRLDKAETRLALADGVLDATRIGGKMSDGDFDLTARLDARAVPAATAKLKVAGLSIRDVLLQAGNVGIVQGRVGIDADLAGAGASERALVSSLTGTARVDVADGAVTGFSLQGVSDRLKRLDQPLDFLRLLQAALAGGQTRFTALSGNIGIDKGVLTSSDLSLTAEAAAGRAVAVVDLPRWRMDLDAEFRLTEHPDAPPIGMRMDGSLDSPRQTFDLNKLQSYLVSRGVGRLLGGKPAASGDQAAPGGQGSSPADQQKKTEPVEILRGILKGLGK